MRSTFLQVMGILCIIFGSMALLMNLLLMRVYVLVGVEFLGTISAIRGALVFVAGIKAVTTYTDRYRAAACVVWGAIVIGFAMVELIVTLAYWSRGAFTVVFDLILLFTVFALPVLYFIAAFRFVRRK